MRSYWLLEFYEGLGWTAFASTKPECKKIMLDSANEEMFACVTEDEQLADDEMIFKLDIFNPDDLRSFEMNHIFVSKEYPYKIHVQNANLCSVIDSQI